LSREGRKGGEARKAGIFVDRQFNVIQAPFGSDIMRRINRETAEMVEAILEILPVCNIVFNAGKTCAFCCLNLTSARKKAKVFYEVGCRFKSFAVHGFIS
jgi:hypothetical protein